MPRFRRNHPVLAGFLGVLVLRVINFLACMAGGLLIFAAGWFVYSNLPFIYPFIFSHVSAVFALLPSDTARFAVALLGYIIFIGVVPPAVIGGIVLPTVMAVMSWRDDPIRAAHSVDLTSVEPPKAQPRHWWAQV